MFESLSDRLSSAFRSLSGRAQLTEENIRDGLREVRLALLEADVNFKVVKEFVERVRERVLGQEVEKSLTPTQQLVKAVHDELVTLLGGETTELNLRGAQPGVIMMVGLQGSGKTTSAGKLANLLRKQKMRPYLVPVDVYRPAAIDQLRTLARQLDIPCFASSADMKPVDIVRAAFEDAKEKQCTVVILDTAGRLHIDAPLMQELVDIKSAVQPQEILFVADAMTGQDAVTVAEAFNKDLALTGVVLTKMDGDARGGAALSIKSVTGASVKYVGVGEKLSDLEVFHPERVAGRILGMGDMLTLIEKAEQNLDQKKAEEMAERLRQNRFTLTDYYDQLQQIKGMGSLQDIAGMIPGMDAKALSGANVDEKAMGRIEAIIQSMTPGERDNPAILNSSRKKRIAAGAGTSVVEINKLLKQFELMQQLVRQMSGNSKAMKRMKRGGRGGLGGLGNLFGGGRPYGF